MAALHDALRVLSPTSFSDVPLDEPNHSRYLQQIFAKAQLLVESVPPPPVDPTLDSARPRASTGTSVASNISEISISSARSDPSIPEHALFQKEWGKPVRLSAKENPLGMGVYKMSGKDGRGAWFARRSVHEGLAFSRWKEALQAEFPDSLKIQGGPGEGNIRGIGGERRVEKKELDGVGSLEVYHLSAQFPGPTTPRDFVTLLLTSSSALRKALSRPSSPETNNETEPSPFTEHPRHFMVISKPCKHPDCPPREGFIRGEYESVEFIREIPINRKKSLSTTNLQLTRPLSATSPHTDKSAIYRHARQPSADHSSTDGRARGKTISFAESRGEGAKGEALDRSDEAEEEEDEIHPVEWIMITRSDPGGSVPRFMVERGTPTAIVSDAGKFLDWTCKRRSPAENGEMTNVPSIGEPITESVEDEKGMEAYQTNGHLAGLDGTRDDVEKSSNPIPTSATEEATVSDPPSGLLSSVANAAYASIETYAPQSIIDRLPARTPTPSPLNAVNDEVEGNVPTTSPPCSPSAMSSVTSVASFASADSHLSSSNLSRPTSSMSKAPSSVHHERELAKLAARKQKLDAKLQKTREKETKNKDDLTSKEVERLRKAEEKHAREILKAEERHAKEVAALHAKRLREEAKAEEKMKRAQDKDEKARLLREREEAREELEVVKAERDILMARIGELQKENTALVARLGRVDGGEALLKEVKEDVSG